MSYCVKCGTKVEESFAFCPKCGYEFNKETKSEPKDEHNSEIKVVKAGPNETSTNTNIYAYNKQEMKKYGIQKNSKLSVSLIIQGIIAIIVGIPFLSFLGFGIIFIIYGIYVLSSKKVRDADFLPKQTKKIHNGMSIHQIRAMFAFIEPINEGFNKHGEYFIYYNTNVKAKEKNKDYEAVYITFDEYAKVDSAEPSYHRTIRS